jgi:hypothetical protein
MLTPVMEAGLNLELQSIRFLTLQIAFLRCLICDASQFLQSLLGLHCSDERDESAFLKWAVDWPTCC